MRHIFCKSYSHSFFILFLFIFSCIPLNAYARWPTFVAPSKDYLLEHHLIDTNSCPPGQGRLVQPFNVTVKSHCKTYCPESWLWKSEDHDCHDLKKHFEFQNYDISHYYDGDGTTLYSEVTAWYGEKNNPRSNSLALIFKTPSEFWHCVELNAHNQEHLVSCANDI